MEVLSCFLSLSLWSLTPSEKVERELEEFKIQFEEISEETEKVQSDVCEMHGFKTLEKYVVAIRFALTHSCFSRLCDYIAIYEDFFTQGLALAKQISKDAPSYRAIIKEVKRNTEGNTRSCLI